MKFETLRYETLDGENAVEIRGDNYVTYTSGTRDPLYVGPDRDKAAASLDMSDEDFESLLHSDEC